MAKAPRRYYTGLIPLETEPTMPPARGRGWTATIEPTRGKKSGRMPDAKHEIVLFAQSSQAAQNALYLIIDSYRLFHAEPPLFGHDMVAEPRADGRATRADRWPWRGMCWVRTTDFPIACHIAAKASRRRQFSYALALYRLSQTTHANSLMDLEPRNYPHQHRSPYPIDHARYAYAIVTAYAVLEQLGLSLTGEAFKNKQWIPSVRQELESRLKDAGVDLTETVLWQLRGGKTKLERTRPPTILRKASWAFGQIRDCEVQVVDAVADIRWLRSGVSAHKMSELAELLSIYDVANAQHLARRLLLDRMSITPEFVSNICNPLPGTAT